MGCCASSSSVDAANPQSADGARGSSNAATTSARRSGAISGRGGAPGPISKSNPTSRRNSAVRSLAAASVQVDVNGKPIEPRKKSLFVRSASHRGRMTALAMSFPKIRRSLMAVQNVFDQYCLKKGNQRKELSLDKLGFALNAICTHKQFSDQEVRELFRKADLDGSRSITFREFLIAVGCGYFLKVNIPDNKAYTEIQNGFRVVEKAFNDMDTDKSGSVDAKEMKSALFSLGDAAGSPADGTSVRSLDILEERFAELDFDGDGSIRFPEFLYGFFSWVGMDEDDGALPNRVIDPALVAAAAGTGPRPPVTMQPAHPPQPMGSPSAGSSGASGGIGDPPPPAAAFGHGSSPASAPGLALDPKAGTASDGAALAPATPGAVDLDPLEKQQQENAAIAEQNAILSSLPSARSLKILERAGSTRAAAAAAAIAAAHSPASTAVTLQGNGLGGGPDFNGGGNGGGGGGTDSKRAPKPA